MTVIALTETGWAPGHRLSTEQARALIRSNLVEVRPDGRSGLWQVRSRGYVGVARVGDVEVRIARRLAVDRLLFLVGYATSGRHWRPEEVPYAPAEARAGARRGAVAAGRPGVAAGPVAGVPGG